MSEPDESLFRTHADLAIAQERLMIALMREFAARAELHRGIDDNRAGAIEFGVSRVLAEGHTVDEAYAVSAQARHEFLARVQERTWSPQHWVDIEAALRDPPVDREPPPHDHGLGR
jgi:hypothetical protein